MPKPEIRRINITTDKKRRLLPAVCGGVAAG